MDYMYLKLTEDEVSKVLDLLAALPLKDVWGLFNNILDQYNKAREGQIPVAESAENYGGTS